MKRITVRDMQPDDEEFVGTCGHVGETKERTASCWRRIPWLREQHRYGLRVKVALIDGRHVGFLYAMPVEIAPWGPVGRDLMAIQCLAANKPAGQGIGRALMEAAEEEARRQERKGIIVIAYYHDFWFMPAYFFEKCGYSRIGEIAEVTDVAERIYMSNRALLWKVFYDSAEPPRFHKPNYVFKPVSGKVVVDLFTTRSCRTYDVEAQRVREVAGEFGGSVVLREYCADDPKVRDEYGLCRGIFINGKAVGWGAEAPKDNVRTEVEKAKQKI
jgi:GNAT superfamily N-acetyltransferase